MSTVRAPKWAKEQMSKLASTTKRASVLLPSDATGGTWKEVKGRKSWPSEALPVVECTV